MRPPPSQDEELRFTVEEPQAGTRLDKFLVANVPDLSRTYLKELIEKGFVCIGRHPVTKAGRAVEIGEEIRLRLAPKVTVIAQPREAKLRIIFQDDFLAVIDKPAGIASHPSPRSKEVTVADAALSMFGNDLPRGQGADRPGIVHRLDRETSGLMLIAKNEKAFDSLRAQFKERTVEKEYRAIVRGEVRFDSDYIEKPIARDMYDPEKMAISFENGRESLTYYETIDRFNDFSYVKCRPKTGRTHQIRVHLASLGHPIVGDRVYKIRGAQWTVPEGAPKVDRQFLHAYSITFHHPKTGEAVSFESPLHSDMKAFLNFLRRHGKKPAEE